MEKEITNLQLPSGWRQNTQELESVSSCVIWEGEQVGERETRTLINLVENGVELAVENKAWLERCVFKIEKRFVD